MICFRGRCMWKPPCFSCGKLDFMRVCGINDGNVVVLLEKIEWISYRGNGVGVTPCEFNMWFIMGFAGEWIQFGKTHTFWQKGYHGQNS